MSDLDALLYWHANLGRHLSDAEPDETTKARLETRMNKGIGPNTLGAGIAAYYIVTVDKAWLIGKIERASTAHVEFVPSDAADNVSGEQFIARWLVSSEMTTPCMIGVIGNANPNGSMAVSHTPAKVHFCEAGKGFSFDLDKVKRAKVLIGGMSWRDTVAPAIRQYFALLEARASGTAQSIEKENSKMLKLLAKTPDLAALIPKLDVRPGSGEYVMLSWLFRTP